jgi:hypothetical protein
MAPRGAYIGPYYSYNNFTRDNQWQYTKGTGNRYVNTHTTLNINTIGFQFGYQLILWKRLALDFALVGPVSASIIIKELLTATSLRKIRNSCWMV